MAHTFRISDTYLEKKQYKKDLNKKIYKYIKMEEQPKELNGTGKIFAIRSKQTDKFYISCTILDLDFILSAYRKTKNIYDEWVKNGCIERHGIKLHNNSSYSILNYEDHYIELLEEHKYTNEEQLKAYQDRCQELKKENKKNCINMIYKKNKDKERYEANKEHNKEKIQCLCGSMIKRVSKREHEKSIKHKTYMKQFKE